MFIVLFLISSRTTAQPVPAPSPVPFTTFWDNLWGDLWAEDFVEGGDFLLSTESILLPTVSLHRIDWDEQASFIGGALDAATIENINFYDMDWSESGSENIVVELEDSFEWIATVTLSTSSFSGTITADDVYTPHIYGMIQSVSIDDNLGNLNQYHIWMPLGRATTLANAQTAAQDLAEEIVLSPFTDTENTLNCWQIWWNSEHANTANLFDDLDGCGSMLDRLLGTGAGAATVGGVGATIGSVVPIVGTGIGAAVGGTVGGIGGFFFSKSRCVNKAKRDYRKVYRTNWANYQNCLLGQE